MSKTDIEKHTLYLALREIFPSILISFKKEIQSAGGFDELMIEKRALERIDGRSLIVTHEDIGAYEEKFLVGKYKKLRPFYNTKIPYSFWSQLYLELKKGIMPGK
jgi:hypothetical protein